MYLFFSIIFLYIISIFPISTTDTDHRIIGGRPVLQGELPYQVSIRRSYNDKHFCGGTLIYADTVVTAAHCMYYTWGGLLPPMVVSTVAGQIDSRLNSESVYRNASKIIVHEDFDRDTFANDIALIRLSEAFPVNSSKFIAVVPMQGKSLKNGSCTVSGWGVQKVNTTKVSDQLLAVDVNIINITQCEQKYLAANIMLTRGMMCAGVSEGEKDACQGDSGGPLVCNGRLVGVISTGKGCADIRYPGIYTDIAMYREWIEDQLPHLSNYTTLKEVNNTSVAEKNNKGPLSFFDTFFMFNSGPTLKCSVILYLTMFAFTFR